MSHQNYQTPYEYPNELQMAQRRRFDPDDASFKDFSSNTRIKLTAKKEKKVKLETEDGQQVQQKQRHGGDTVRPNVIAQNLQLIEDNPPKLNASKTFQLKKTGQIQNRKTKELKIVADSLVKKGYGFNLFEEYIEEQGIPYLLLNRQKYKSCTVSIIQKTYRKIELFLRTECQKMVQNLRHEEMRLFVRYLLKFNIYFQKVEAATLVKFICYIYELQTVTISEFEAVHLYKAILQVLKRILNGEAIKPAVIEEEIQERIQYKTNNWREKYDDQLIQFYQLNQNFQKLHKCFCLIHPEIANHLTPEKIQKRLENILFGILIKVKYFQEKNKERLEHFTDLSEKKMWYLVKSPTCNDIRLHLFDCRESNQHWNGQKIIDLLYQIGSKIGGSHSQNTYKFKKSLSMVSQANRIKVTKYMRTQKQQEAQDWSKSISHIPAENLCKVSHATNRSKSKEIRGARPSRYDEVSDEYSDS